jgi:rod shape determining protein RodA
LIILQPDVGSALVYIAFILVLYREGLSFYVLLIALLIVLLSIISLIVELSYVFIGLCIVAVLITGLLIELKHALFSAISIIIASFLVYSLAYFLKLKISLPYLLFIGLLAAGLFGYIMAYRLRLNNLYIIITFLILSISYSYSVDYIFDNVLEKHQKSRVNVLLGFDDDLKGVGYNVHQSKIAIGSGGITGKGFLQGTQTKFDFVPEQSTDFIFCTVGEEWGFVGSFTIILLFTILLLRLIFLAERQRSSFSRMYGYGLIYVIFVHIVINIGMTIGLAPVIGIPLPFFSYGGSSLWAFSILLFIFLRLDASRSELL